MNRAPLLDGMLATRSLHGHRNAILRTRLSLIGRASARPEGAADRERRVFPGEFFRARRTGWLVRPAGAAPLRRGHPPDDLAAGHLHVPARRPGAHLVEHAGAVDVRARVRATVGHAPVPALLFF